MPYATLFPGQEPGEKIILVLHRHSWILFKFVFVYLIFAGLPLLFKYLIETYTFFVWAEPLGAIISLGLSLYYLFLVTLFFRSWLDYYLDIWIITSERIVSIEQKGLFARQVSTQKLYRIQDVTAEVKGILPTFFHYGNVYIQTAGEEERFIFKEIPSPYEVSKKIMWLVDDKKKKMGGIV